MEAPLMMLFLIFVYFIRNWYYTYPDDGNTTIKKQHLAILKEGLAVSELALLDMRVGFFPAH